MTDQTGKVVVVTGATHGLGYEVSKAFAAKNAALILAVRNMALGQERVNEFCQINPAGKFDVLPLALDDLASVRQFANEFKRKYQRLDVLVNNAGIMAVPYGKTKDGFEMHIGVNYLGHFALTGLLLPVVKHTPGCRVLAIASGAERFGNINVLLADFDQQRRYERWTAYGHSKLAQLMFAYELNRRFQQHGYQAEAMAAHPGFARTNLRVSVMPTERNLFHRYLNAFFELISQRQELGALPLLYAATAPEAKGGEYYGPNRFQMWGYPARNHSSPPSHDEQLAKKLWEKSEAVTGVHYEF
jgi:hypothetical protein